MTQQSKFTPGPWEVSPYLRPDLDDDPMGVYRLGQLSAAKLTEAYFAAEPETQELANVHTENEANARLIAQAPEMYELLSKMAQWAENPSYPLHQASWCDKARRIKAEIDGE